MSTYYTQEQLDSIGVLIANKIASNGEELKQFVQDKIDALEPVEPPAPTEPEAGGGTTPAPAAGMFLGDGREIKQMLYEVVIPNQPHTNFVSKYFSQSIDMSKVIDVTGILLLADKAEIINRQENQWGEARYWDFSLSSIAINVNGFENKAHLYGATAKIIVTSLV